MVTILEYPVNISDTGFFIQFQFYERKDISKLIVDTYRGVKNTITNTSKKKQNKSKSGSYEGCGNKKEKITVSDIKETSIKVANTIITKSLLSELILKDTINMYIPNSLGATNSANVGWSLSSSGTLGMVINAINEGGDILKTIENNSGVLFRKGVEQLGKKIAGEKISQIYTDAKETLHQIHGIKPKKDDELMFLDGVTPRNQSVSFRFMPRNKEEYELVKLITQTMLLNTYPDLVSSGIKYPPVVQMRVYFKNNLVLGFRNMQIEDIQVPIMPEGLQNYEDGSPAVIDMTLSLKEAGKYYRKHYVEDAKKIFSKNKSKE